MTSPAHAAELTKAIGRGTLFGILANFVQLATRLVTVPFAVSHLGLDGYGVWSIVMTAASYMRFGSVGSKSAFQKYVAEATGKGSFELANMLISTGTCAILVLSLIGLLPLTLFSVTIAHAIGVPPGYVRSTAGALALLAVVMVLSNTGSAFEAIVMGGHRIDLVRKFNLVTTVLEAIAIIVLLHYGMGIFAMGCVMGCSEVVYVSFCFVQARRVLPQVEVRFIHVRREVWKELLRFAGSYQLRGTFELAYQTILPIAVLSSFGARAAGLYALASKLVIAALLPQEALLQPILSGGSMIYASGGVARMSALIYKAFKILLLLSVPVLGVVAVFGERIIFAWTGQGNASIRAPLILLCVAGLGKAVYTLGSVLYRTSGRSTSDNVAQGLRIICLLIIGVLSPRLGFVGVLTGLAAVECCVALGILFIVQHTFELVAVRRFLPDAGRIAAASALMVVCGLGMCRLPLMIAASERVQSLVQMGIVGMVYLIVAVPALRITGCLSTAEVAGVWSIIGGEKLECIKRTATR